MEDKYIMDGVLNTASFIEQVKEETGYEEQGFKASPLFVRTNNTGDTFLVTVIFQTSKIEGKTYLQFKQVISIDIQDGSIIERQDASVFFDRLDYDVRKPILASREDGTDKNIVGDYRKKIMPAMDNIRKQSLKNGEINSDDYMDYLTYALYSFSTELSDVLSRISRTCEYSDTFQVRCRNGHKSNIPVKNTGTIYVDGNRYSCFCPACRDKIEFNYKKTKKFLTYREAYLTKRNSGNSTEGKEDNAKVINETFIDNSAKFSVDTDAVVEKNSKPNLTPIVPEEIQDEEMRQQWILAQQLMKQSEEKAEKEIHKYSAKTEDKKEEPTASVPAAEVQPIQKESDEVLEEYEEEADAEEVYEAEAMPAFDEEFEKILFTSDEETDSEEPIVENMPAESIPIVPVSHENIDISKTSEEEHKTALLEENSEDNKGIIIGLNMQKKLFEAIDSIINHSCMPPRLFLLLGDDGCGINTALKSFIHGEVVNYNSSSEFFDVGSIICIRLNGKYSENIMSAISMRKDTVGCGVFIRSSEEEWKRFKTMYPYAENMFTATVKFQSGKLKEFVRLYVEHLHKYGIKTPKLNEEQKDGLFKMPGMNYGKAKNMADQTAFKMIMNGKTELTEEDINEEINRFRSKE